MTDHELVEQMRAVEFDLAAAGDFVGAHMMGDLTEAYVNGQPEGNARLAVAAARKRLSQDVAP